MTPPDPARPIGPAGSETGFTVPAAAAFPIPMEGRSFFVPRPGSYQTHSSADRAMRLKIRKFPIYPKGMRSPHRNASACFDLVTIGQTGDGLVLNLGPGSTTYPLPLWDGPVFTIRPECSAPG